MKEEELVKPFETLKGLTTFNHAGLSPVVEENETKQGRSENAEAVLIKLCQWQIYRIK